MQFSLVARCKQNGAITSRTFTACFSAYSSLLVKHWWSFCRVNGSLIITMLYELAEQSRCDLVELGVSNWTVTYRSLSGCAGFWQI